MTICQGSQSSTCVFEVFGTWSSQLVEWLAMDRDYRQRLCVSFSMHVTDLTCHIARCRSISHAILDRNCGDGNFQYLWNFPCWYPSWLSLSRKHPSQSTPLLSFRFGSCSSSNHSKPYWHRMVFHSLLCHSSDNYTSVVRTVTLWNEVESRVVSK